MSALFRLEAFPSTVGSPEEALVYPGAPQRVALSMADGQVPLPSLRTEGWVWLSPRGLYVCFAASTPGARFPHPGPAGAARTRNLWDKSEVCEVFIGRAARSTGQYREYEVAPDGRWSALAVVACAGTSAGDQDIITGARFAATIDRVGAEWRAAIEIPWSDLNCGPNDGPWDCNLYRSILRPAGGHLLAWSPTGYGPHCFHRPERFGILFAR